jgi:suppressor for copper-sensitivity B
MRFLLFFLIIVTGSFAYADNKFVTEQSSLQIITHKLSSDKHLIGLNFAIENGWKIYWKNPGDSGSEVKISIDGYDSELIWPAPKRHIDKITEDLQMQSFIYSSDIVIPVLINFNGNKPESIKLHVDYSICAKICIPYSHEFHINIADGDNNRQLHKIYNDLAQYKKNTTIKIDNDKTQFINDNGRLFLKLVASGINEIANVDIFAEYVANISFRTAVVNSLGNGNAEFIIPVDNFLKNIDLSGREIEFTIVSGNMPSNYQITIPKSINGKVELPESDGSVQKQLDNNIVIMVIYAFIGGFILNIMPCVLPVLSLKLMSIIKHRDSHPMKVRLSLLASASGIIFSFLVIAGVTVFLKIAGQSVGWGIQFQEPKFIIFLMLIILLFALNLLGKFEINLPVWLSGVVHETEQKHHHGIAGSFMVGAFAALLATPCTAPFLGVAIGFALAQNTAAILTVFFAMGLGMAQPYIVLAIFPSLIKYLPKSGAWMGVVKKVFGALLLLTVFLLLYVLLGQIGKLATIVTFMLCLLVKFFIEMDPSSKGKKSIKYILLTSVVVLCFYIPTVMQDRYKAHNGQINDIWQEFEGDKIANYINQGKVVVVDVTADWCFTCKVNKFLVLERGAVLERLMQDDIIALVADMTNENEVANKYLQSFRRSGIPFNVVYGRSKPDGIILSTLLTEEEVLQAISDAK